MTEQNVTVIQPEELLSKTKEKKEEGYRLVAISCTNKDGIELSYSFDKDYQLSTLRLNISAETEIESVTGLYSFAFLYENEVKELFGVPIQNITPDFQGTLYTTAVQTPFGKTKNE